VLAEVSARNTGRLEWTPPLGWWPQLHLSYHLLDAAGTLVRWDNERFPMPRVVAPGESVRFLFTFRAPDEPGAHLFEWDLLSEGDCWFAECGSRPARAALVTSTRP
jgi:hypothetical protein